MIKGLRFAIGTATLVVLFPQVILSHPRDFYAHTTIWIEGNYTEPTNNALSVGDLLFAQSNQFWDGGRRHTFIDPDGEFNYALGIAYHIPFTQTRIFMDYDHWNDDFDNKGDINISNIGLDPSRTAHQSSGIASFDEHAHTFRIGASHNVLFTDHFCMDFLAFLEYDRVRINLDETNSGLFHAFVVEFPFEINTINRRETQNSVNGFGPGVGFNARWYSPDPHWHVFAGVNTILLHARNKFKQFFEGFEVVNNEFILGSPSLFYIYDPEDSDSILGKVDVRFGINYHCQLHPEMYGSQLNVTLGVRYLNIFNAFKHGNSYYNPEVVNAFTEGPGSHVVPQNFAANLGFPSDWGRFGPYLQIRVGGLYS